jgi:hypothetical protein
MNINKKHLRTNGYCLVNHIVGLPVNQKRGLTNPMFDYERLLYDTLMDQPERKEDSFKDKHLRQKKTLV